MFKETGLYNRLIKGISANGLGQLVTVAIQIVSLPVFLHFWGKELYGEWLILSAAPMFLSMSDLGFTIAAENEMTMSVAKDNRQGALQIFQSIWLLLIALSLIALIVLVLLFTLVPINRFLSIELLSNFEAASIVSLLALYVLLGMHINLLSGGFRCDGNYAVGVCYRSLLRLLDYLVVTVAVYLGAFPIIAALCFILTRSLGMLIMSKALKKRSPWITHSYHHANLGTIKRLAKPACASMGLPLIQAMSNQGVIVILGSLLGASDVVVFSTLRTLSRFALQLMRMIRATISPELSTAYATQNMVLARKLHRHSCQASLWISFMAVIGLIVIGDWIIEIWTRGEVEMNFVLFYLMLATIIFSSFWYTSFAVLTSTNQHHKIVPFYLFVTTITLFLCILLIPKLGLNFAAFSLMLIDISMLILVLKQSLSLLQDNFLSYLKTVLIPPFKMIIN